MDELFLSEVHLEVPHATQRTLASSRFSFPQSSSCDSLDTGDDGADSDGDAIVPRSAARSYFTIQHQLATPLRNVGQQVWNGGCFFADLFIAQPGLVEDKVVLDIGGGVGLSSIAAARTAQLVFCTDVDIVAMDLAVSNAKLNAPHFKHGGSVVRVRHLDLLDGAAALQLPSSSTQAPALPPSPPCSTTQVAPADPTATHRPNAPLPPTPRSQPAATATATTATTAPPTPNPAPNATPAPSVPSQFQWRPDDLPPLHAADLIIAADVVYDDALTAAFVSTTLSLMAACVAAGGACPMLLVAVEKRFNFTLRDLDVRAPAYDRFLACLEEAAALHGAAGLHCSMERMDASSIPQAIAEYDRSADMELWRVQLRRQGGGV